MARSKDEFLGCSKCRTVLFRLKGEPGDNHSVFLIRREALTAQVDHRVCEACKEPLVRMAVAAWPERVGE
jgi:hypothetical protein